VGYIENCGELGKWYWKVFGGLRGFCGLGIFVSGAESFWSSQHRNATERFLAVGSFWGFCHF